MFDNQQHEEGEKVERGSRGSIADFQKMLIKLNDIHRFADSLEWDAQLKEAHHEMINKIRKEYQNVFYGKKTEP